MEEKKKLMRTATIAASIGGLLKGQLKYMSQYYSVSAVASTTDDTLEKVGKREGIAVFPLAMARSISIVQDLKSVWNLYRLFKRERPHIVHSMTPKAGLLTMMAAYFAGVPHRLHTFTGLIFPTKTGAMQKLLIVMDRVLCFCATRVYPEGQGVKKDLEKFKITSKTLKVIANGNVNGIDLDFFDASRYNADEKQELKQKLDIKDSDFVFLFAGRIVRDKGINELVGAFKKLLETNSNAILLVLGDYERELDPILPETEAVIVNHDNVICTGWQDDVRPFFAISDCMVLPSYREGFPNTVIQAGAMKLPSIVTDISGCNEIIIEGRNGTLVPVKNATVLHQKMKEMIDKTVIYDPEECYELIASRYKQDFVWEKLLEEYRSLD
ncbi:glycosyltransferase family 4 protein [Flagellimonas sp. HMM57]|uniref:glycosyltransferase family 4 protein n=1 Tax=unclassified Flagellimonas TaxID=2644544 RepID=UPI0013CFDB76|nr:MULTISPECIES: glycosyltransferase family 4 protein [unclassified Flagellimonas]UII76130.1 glycosyltransferase family 4 protein [Flagellimonas sp. HMM57]